MTGSIIEAAGSNLSQVQASVRRIKYAALENAYKVISAGKISGNMTIVLSSISRSGHIDLRV